VTGRDFAGIGGRLAEGGSAAIAAEVRAKAAAMLTDDAARIFKDAQDRWPIKTGASRAALFVRDESTATMIVIRIGNTAPYAKFIKSAKIGRGPGPSFRWAMTRELGDPVRAVRKTLPARVAELAGAILEGRG